MSWYWWVLIWAVLLLLSAALMARLGLTLWRKASLLAQELSTAADRLAEVSNKLEDLAEASKDPAVFTAASQLRQERYLDERRRAGKRPPAGVKDQSTRSTRPAGQRVR